MEHLYSNLGPISTNSCSHFATQRIFFNLGGFLSVFEMSDWCVHNSQLPQMQHLGTNLIILFVRICLKYLLKIFCKLLDNFKCIKLFTFVEKTYTENKQGAIFLDIFWANGQQVCFTGIFQNFAGWLKQEGGEVY